MTIPTPPPDNSGGHIIIKVSNGTLTHRMRFHVLSFNADATGSYVTPPAGGEASVQATATAVMTQLAAFYSTGMTLSLDAVFFNIPPGPPIQAFSVVAPAPVAGLSASANGPAESFYCFNFRSSLGRRGRVFIMSPAGWTYQVATVESANGAGTTRQVFVNYLSTAHTAIVCHDNGKPVAPMRFTTGVNKRLRRRAGNA